MVPSLAISIQASSLFDSCCNMRTPNALLLILSAVGSLAQFPLHHQVGKCLMELPQEDVFLPGQTGYDRAKYNWNDRLPEVSPAVIIQARSTADVVQAVKCANMHSLDVVARSGGHDYEGYGLGGEDGKMIIDLVNMHETKFDNNNSTVSVESGQLVGRLLHFLWKERGVALPIGSDPRIGVGGHTLGGGYGLYGRLHGLMADTVESMEVVTAAGDVVTASKEENSDLFWALLGAGHSSYGIVTKFHFRYFYAPKKFPVFSFTYPAGSSNFSEILLGVQRWYASSPPNEITAIFNIYPGGKMRLAGTILTDDLQQQRQLFDEMVQKLPKTSIMTNQLMNMPESYVSFNGGRPKVMDDLAKTQRRSDKFYFKAKSGYLVEPVAEEVADKIYEIMSKVNGHVLLMFDMQGGKISESTSKDTSFIHRNTICSVQMGVFNQKSLPWVQEIYTLLRPSFPEAYQNYIDSDEKDWKKMYYGDSYNKLVKIKNKYDPTNVFNFPRSIPLW
ncbi:hypothetical protein K7432_007332 [Basidiobolus ranarum]|uniref:FAD-binding PCMH-type domain-containing protein n=1 Tax=Basidiobolus ranarum TaxID=34480 RepID=A0ABR2WTK3_9FUNG